MNLTTEQAVRLAYWRKWGYSYPGKRSKKQKRNVMQKGTVELKEEKDNIVVFEPKLITGGKEPPSEFNNWLDKLEVGLVFTCRDKLATDIRQPNYFALALFKIGGRDGKVTFLLSPDNPTGLPVDSQRFCNRFDLFETIDTFVEEGQQQTVLQETEKTDGNGDRV